MQREMKYWYLKNFDLFSDLNKEQINDLSEVARFVRMKKGQSIYFATEQGRKLYFLINGKVKISEIDGFGNELIKNIVLGGDHFGELSNTDVKQTQEFAEILSSEVIVCIFNQKDFEEIMQKHPVLALSFAKRMAEKLRGLENRYTNLVFKDVKARLKSFLVEWANREGKLDENGTVIKNYLTHSEIANIISSSRQTVTTLINELKEEGVILYSRKVITIPNLHAIAA
ncbi:Crp/Fnr family transcriptional regulator [Roseivirga sp.]|uniref:Crp/Fnr family transcriptional regulator n=1 Tax=Roseivirga sp. TaxID=1964215 RepID=UPI003B524CAB